jgi:hypothetical protein
MIFLFVFYQASQGCSESFEEKGCSTRAQLLALTVLFFFLNLVIFLFFHNFSFPLLFFLYLNTRAVCEDFLFIFLHHYMHLNYVFEIRGSCCL